jgi:hypothetical protein
MAVDMISVVDVVKVIDFQGQGQGHMHMVLKLGFYVRKLFGR